ncbi:hypothetical protein H1R20_g14835, partial [Candolleomyces eurysporus]
MQLDGRLATLPRSDSRSNAAKHSTSQAVSDIWRLDTEQGPILDGKSKKRVGQTQLDSDSRSLGAGADAGVDVEMNTVLRSGTPLNEEYGRHIARKLLEDENEAKFRCDQGASVMSSPGDVDRIRFLERELGKERATVSSSQRVIGELMGKVEKQKKTIEALNGERTLILTDRRDRESVWGTEKADLERLVMKQRVRVSKLNAEMQDLKSEYKVASNRQWESERHIRSVEEGLREAREDLGRERMQLSELKRLFAETERRLETTEKLLKTRTDELTAAQAFMTTADQCSGTDVSHMVTQLNDVIYQCGALIADEVIKRDGIEEHLGEAALARLATASQELITFGWNQALVQRLRPDVLEQDTVLLEAMVQNMLTRRCYRIISSFCDESGEVDRYLAGLWRGIVKSTDTTIAKNWLAITHSQLKMQKFDTSRTMRNLMNVMFTAGWRVTTPEKERVGNRIEEKVQEIFTTALKIKEMVTQKILSAEVRVVYYRPDTQYDTVAMEDVYESGRTTEKAEPGQPILCSTGLGVQYIAAKPISSGGKRKSTILKTKVVLASAVAIEQQGDAEDERLW